MHICNMFPASGRDPPNAIPAQRPHPWGWPSHLRPSVKILLPNKIPPCSAHYCRNAQTIYLQRITAHKVPL